MRGCGAGIGACAVQRKTAIGDDWVSVVMKPAPGALVLRCGGCEIRGREVDAAEECGGEGGFAEADEDWLGESVRGVFMGERGVEGCGG